MFQKLKHIITHTSEPDKAILDLLLNTTIGTNGAKYKHLHTASKIHTLHQPTYISVRKKSKVIGNMTICNRPILVKQKPIKSFYIRYFAFNKAFQSKGKIIHKNRQSIFEKYLQALFSSSNLNANNPEQKPSYFWAFIDPENNKSWNVANRFGFETIGYFSTFAFSRFFPKKSESVLKVIESEKEIVWQKIQQFYKNHTNLSKVSLFKNDDYYVFKENNKIVAGLQIHKVHWEIEQLPGLKGKLLVNFLPYIPFLNKIINPKNYNFLAVEGLFWENGFEKTVEPLLESVLATSNCNSMLMWADLEDLKLINLFNSINLGVLQNMKSDNSIEIVGKFNHFNKSKKQDIIQSLKYISGFDTT